MSDDSLTRSDGGEDPIIITGSHDDPLPNKSGALSLPEESGSTINDSNPNDPLPDGSGRDPVTERARDMIYQLYQLFKTHPHDAQWIKKSVPLSQVRRSLSS